MHKQLKGNSAKHLLALGLILSLFVSTFVHGQDATPEPFTPTQTDTNEVLRLEQTIRANQEQPQVLTIVPWQLPSHQRLNEARTWQPEVTELPLIERGQFLRDLSIVNDILAESTANSEAEK